MTSDRGKNRSVRRETCYRFDLYKFHADCSGIESEPSRWEAGDVDDVVSTTGCCGNEPHCAYRGVVNIHYIQYIYMCVGGGDRVGTVVMVLCYKSEGRWFDSIWCHWNPSDRTMTLGSTQPLTEMSTRSVSRGKSGRCVRLTTLRPSCAVVM
jgi:hypothetical protein